MSKWARDRNYLVLPINGDLKYHRLGSQEKSNTDEPSEKVSLVLSDVSITVTEVLKFKSFIFTLICFPLFLAFCF